MLKLSEVLAKLVEAKFTLDGKSDYKRVVTFAQGLGVNNLTNPQVWKLIDRIGQTGEQVEDDL